MANFSKLFNGELMQDFQSTERESTESHLDPRLCVPINKDEIKETLKKIINEKVDGPDQTSAEVWKYLGEERLNKLVELFNVIFTTAKMPREWRFSIVIPLYKNKRNVQHYNNYRGIKLLSHTIKL